MSLVQQPSNFVPDIIHPLIRSFLEKNTAEQWGSFQARSADDATKILVAELILEIIAALSNFILTSPMTPKTEKLLMSELEESLPQTFSEALGIPDEVDNLRLKTLTGIIHEEVIKQEINAELRDIIDPLLEDIPDFEELQQERSSEIQKVADEVVCTFYEMRSKKSSAFKAIRKQMTSFVTKSFAKVCLMRILAHLKEKHSQEMVAINQSAETILSSLTSQFADPQPQHLDTEDSFLLMFKQLRGDKVLKEEQRSKKNKKYVQFVIEKVLFTVCSDANMVPETRDELIDSLTETVWSNVQEEQFYIHAEVFKNIQKEIRRSLYKNLSSPENVLFLITHQDPLVVDRILTVVHRKLLWPQRERNIFEKIFSSLGSSISRIFKRTSP
ncbi:unnamed protein product [Tetraodon nigroviridis]|uniref:(spotted green pufferfish) hypothetical protein n=1 Tax=Tetraodon nigroviridis TaxID=99883 RepID=Q4TCA5_TETNG|nr:unnamed protein product [Tetraodon nigroviridis]